jgi:F0F1-type ATP synthase assembly protein I
MLLIGISYLLLWLLIQVFNLALVKAVLVVAIIFILLGLVAGENPWGFWKK